MVLNYSRSLAEDFAGEWLRWGQWWPGSLGSLWGQFGLPGNSQPYLKTFLAVATGELLLAS